MKYPIDFQYWHAFLNYKFFDNSLEPAIIKAREPNEFEDDEGIKANTYTEFVPFVIGLYFYPDEDIKHMITVLLHEMVHQFCREHEDDLGDNWDYEDEDEEAAVMGKYDEAHNAFFKDMAQQHGLTMNGYKLTDVAERVIDEHLEVVKKFSQMDW